MTDDEEELERLELVKDPDFQEWAATNHVVAHVERRILASMRQRCRNPKHKGYKYYGARGINVCRRWRFFELFYKDVGPRPSPDHSIDRIDNDRGYEPGNVRWATRQQQNANRRPRARK